VPRRVEVRAPEARRHDCIAGTLVRQRPAWTCPRCLTTADSKRLPLLVAWMVQHKCEEANGA
jgi:hypothetical protein